MDVPDPRDLGTLAGTLRAASVAVRDGFLSQAEVGALAACAAERQARGDFIEARVGAGPALARRAQIRGDSICWLTEPEFDAERAMLAELDLVRRRLNLDAFLGLAEIELHYARYPPGTAYVRHVDHPFGRSQRRVSFVLYLNEHWSPADGGTLKIFEDDGDRWREIEPVGGRLVLFMTEQREHEVTPVKRERLSMTGWFRARG